MSTQPKKRASQKAAYKFLTAHALSGETFTGKELQSVTSWSDTSLATYMSKQLRDYVLEADGGYRVRRSFRRVSEEKFYDEVVTQVRHHHTSYCRAQYRYLINYEFLLPLTREGELKRALDDLFFEDTLEDLIHEVGLPYFSKLLDRGSGEPDDELVARAVRKIGELIGGYSITHVSGRFRIHEELLARKYVGELLAEDRPYLVDETTALVRFIIPCQSSRVVQGEAFEFEEAEDEVADMPAEVASELRLVRHLFFPIFVEAVARTVRGEEVIWLIESAPDGQRLYALERGGTPVKRRAKRPKKKSKTKKTPGPSDVARDSKPSSSAAEEQGVDTKETSSRTKKKTSSRKTGQSTSLKAAKKGGPTSVRVWLSKNGYDEVLAQVEQMMSKWESQGKKTRRNWWDILSGDPDGKPRIVDGEEFPVLAAAQKRQGKPVTKNALCNDPSEQTPTVRASSKG